jgi:selenocysteine lyase/cysteine desulfurase
LSLGAAPLARSAFALAPGLVYLNHAAVGVLPRATRDALRAMLDDHAARGVLGVGPREAELPAYRARVGEFVGGRGDEVALLRTTGEGATILAQGLDLGPGDEVVLGANEFGANAYPWFALRARGVTVTQLPPGARMTPDALRAALSPRTRLVALSWVAFDDGYRHDLAPLAEVAHAGGALFAVDAIQGLGPFPLDVTASGIDALYGGGPKWLLATQGIAFLWLRAALLERVALRLPGWRSMADMWDYLAYDQPLAPDAARYEAGTPNLLGALALATSIGVLADAGVERIAAHVLALTDRLVEGLRGRGYEILSDRSREDVKSAIVRFRKPGTDHAALGERLAQAGFVVTARPAALRVSPHGYNTADEIDALLEALPR